MSTEQHHATIFLPPDVAGPIEEARRRWDPVMAAQIAAHVTLAYPREAPSRDLPPHVTIVHPRTSTRGRECWESGTFELRECEFTVEDVTVTAFDGARWIALARCPLMGHRLEKDGLARPRNSA